MSKFKLPSLKQAKLTLLRSTKTSTGFTLIELLISIVIIVILSVIGISSFNVANNRNELRNQAKEIVSEMRKIRTDSVAASKPVTGAGNAVDPSCKDPTTTATIDQGTYYGTYITFNATSFDTGVLCWTSGGATNVSGTASNTPLKQDVTAATSGGSTFFFSFDGSVYQTSSVPPYAFASQPSSPPLAGTPAVITLSKGGESFYVYVNGAGLICTQKDAPAVDNCADTP